MQNIFPNENILPALAARRRSLFWRIHFWAALIASPFALLAALTGILYIFTPQIEQVLYPHLDHIEPAGEMRTLDDSIAAARAVVAPGSTLTSVALALRPSDSMKVFFTSSGMDNAAGNDSADAHAMHGQMNMPTMAMPPRTIAAGKAITVYVDPYTTTILGVQVDSERFSLWSKKLHSSLLQGEGWRWMIELAASWLMVMLLTGIYLWWPRNKQSGIPQKDAKGRTWWSQWHAFFGVVLSVMSLVILTTGLTWSKYAGSQIRLARDAVGQQSPQAPRNLKSIAIEGKTPMTWQQAADIARQQAPDIALRLVAPREPLGTWRVTNYDLTQPEKRIDMVLDAYSGKVLFRSGWDQQTAFGKATGIGIPFHRGEFGLWNQLLLLIFGLGIVFSLLSGWIMFFKRRKAGTFGLPKLLPGAWRAAPAAFWIVALLLCAIMPLLALSASVVAALEILLHHKNRKNLIRN